MVCRVSLTAGFFENGKLFSLRHLKGLRADEKKAGHWISILSEVIVVKAKFIVKIGTRCRISHLSHVVIEWLFYGLARGDALFAAYR